MNFSRYVFDGKPPDMKSREVGSCIFLCIACTSCATFLTLIVCLAGEEVRKKG